MDNSYVESISWSHRKIYQGAKTFPETKSAFGAVSPVGIFGEHGSVSR